MSLFRGWRFLLVASGLLLGSADALAATGVNDDPTLRLAAMFNAMQTLNYQGTLVLYKNDALDTVKFSHAVNAKGQAQEHISALNTPLREILRNKEKVLCIYPEAQAMIIDHLPLQRSFLMEYPDSTDDLQANYTMMLAGEETVALQRAKIVMITPRDVYRYARRFWIGKDNHLPLRYEMLDDAGNILEQIAFTDLSVNPGLAATYTDLERIDNPGMSVQHIHQVQPLPFNQAGFALHNIPNGFKEVFFTRRKMHDGDELVEHLLLKDGLSSVSVYVEKQNAPINEGVKVVGAINSYSRQIGAYQVTVMGDVPVNAVRFIAQGVKLREP